MKHIWTVLCQKSSIDVETNQLSLFNCLEEINLTLENTEALNNNLVIPVEFQLVSYWSREQADTEVNLTAVGELVDASGKMINSFNNSLVVKQGILRFRNRTNIQGLAITGPGRYYFRLYQIDKMRGVAKELVAELPLDVKINYKLMEIPHK